jgi:hypothetical protein|tara:strand:+ start:960 stop:1163 length:204 start_codon:yes stop_codon:yes gene_type:complete
MIEGMGELIRRFRPNIFAGMLFVTALGGGISYMGYRMGNEGVISAAGVGAIIGIINLCSKILETDHS